MTEPTPNPIIPAPTDGESKPNGGPMSTLVQPTQQAIDAMAFEKIKADHAAAQIAKVGEFVKYVADSPGVKGALEGIGAKLKAEATLMGDREKYAHEQQMQAQRIGERLLYAAAFFALVVVGSGITLVHEKILTIEVAATLGSCLTTLLLAVGLIRKNQQQPPPPHH